MKKYGLDGPDMSTMVLARFESVPMARSAAHALVADGFTHEVVSMFYGAKPARERGLWARLLGAMHPRRNRSDGEILLVVQLSAAEVAAAIGLLRDAGSVSVEQSRDDWQAAPWERAAVRSQPVARRHAAHRAHNGSLGGLPG